ncbi:MAG: hypothetical protein SVR94_17940 [Pseudomonadota bacterium]|nr:hypothetical protein [Pseudomonadota bacterium]
MNPVFQKRFISWHGYHQFDRSIWYEIKALSLLFAATLLTVPSSYAASILVNSSVDNSTSGDRQCTLREAINNANEGNDTTNGDCLAGDAQNNAIDLTQLNENVVFLTQGPLEISGRMTLTGPGAETLILNGQNNQQIFYVKENAHVNITGMTITQGKLRYGFGGGLKNLGTTTLVDTRFTDNDAKIGGAIYNKGNLTIVNSYFSNNHADDKGGGLYNLKDLTLIKSTVTENTAERGSGVFNNADDGGPGYLYLEESYIYDNSGYDCANLGLIFTDTLSEIRDASCQTELNPEFSPPMLVSLATFEAAPQTKNRVRLTWRTLSEHNHVGFLLWRAQLPETIATCEEAVRLQAYQAVQQLTFQVAQTGERTQGHHYAYVDKTVKSGKTYCYLLQDVDIEGNLTEHWAFLLTVTP